MTKAFVIRHLVPADIAPASQLYREAFAAYLRLPEPRVPDEDFVRSRILVHPEGAWAAEQDGQLISLSFTSRWGDFAVAGPTATKPAGWTAQAGRACIEASLAALDAAGVRACGGFTFATSVAHIELFRTFGFRPRFLTLVLGRSIRAGAATMPAGWRRFSQVPRTEHDAVIAGCRELTDAQLAGMDLASEIRGACEHGLGDTVFATEGSRVVAMAVCQIGAGTEAGAETCRVKFATVLPDQRAAERLDQLLSACDALGVQLGAVRVKLGVNTARERLCDQLSGHKFRSHLSGVALHRPSEAWTCHRDAYVIDDWR
jgi:hypothetical protein